MNMKTVFVLLAVLSLGLLLTACDASVSTEDSIEAQDSEAEGLDVDVNADGSVDAAIDLDADLEADVSVGVDADLEVVEVELDLDNDAAVEISATEGFCEPGSTYVYESSEGSVDSEVIGLTTYQGSELCQAESTTVISSPAGDITSQTTYYFDSSYSEFWVETSITSDMMPEPQVSLVHIVDGEVSS